MNINSPKYPQWKRYQNKKNLIRRTKRKMYLRKVRTDIIANNSRLKDSPNYNPALKRKEFPAPERFSFIENPKETIVFFNDIFSFIKNRNNFGKSLYIDISKTTVLTTDALMYLLAVVNNLNEHFSGKYSFSGNVPENSDVKKLLSESGFYNFVKYRGNEPLSKNENMLQIASGHDVQNEAAKNMSDFVCKIAGVNTRACSFLYTMMIELMSNTLHHAYEKKILVSQWYCFAKYDGEQKISFTFMDTGAGIPSTVKKNFVEKIDVLKLKSEGSYIISALNGEFRTATSKKHHGKGLPKIREFATESKIENLHIITNKANVNVYKDSYKSEDFSTPLQGTLYHWQIDVSTLRK